MHCEAMLNRNTAETNTQVPRESLHDCTLEFDERSEATHQEQLRQALSKKTQKQREDTAKDFGIHLINSGLHGFAEGATVQGSSTHIFGVETMHCMDLGVGLYIVDYAAEYLEKKGKKHLVAELNKRILEMPRADDFALPYCDGAYFSDHSRVQAREHRNMVQVNPHLFNGIDDDLCELACL